jgi:hypothetical protein
MKWECGSGKVGKKEGEKVRRLNEVGSRKEE